MDEVITRAVGIAFAFVRSLIQGFWAGVVTWLASLGIELTEDQVTAVEIALTALVFAATVAGLRALESVEGDAPWQVGARRVGKWLMVGTSALQPTYGKPNTQVAASSPQTRSKP